MTTIDDAPRLELVSAPRDRRRAITRDAAVRAATDLLSALGADLQQEELRDTPRRMVDAYAELLTPEPFRPTTFPNDRGYDELVLVRSIPFTPSAFITCCHSTVWRTSGTCPGAGSWGCPSWRGWSNSSPATCRSRSA